MPDVDQPLKCRFLTAGRWQLGDTALTAHYWNDDRQWHLSSMTTQASAWIDDHGLYRQTFRTRRELVRTVQALLAVTLLAVRETDPIPLIRVRDGLHRTSSGNYEVHREVEHARWAVVRADDGAHIGSSRTLAGARDILLLWGRRPY